MQAYKFNKRMLSDLFSAVFQKYRKCRFWIQSLGLGLA